MLFKFFQRSERRSQPPRDPVLRRLLALPETAAGVPVTAETATAVPAVHAAVTVISESMAALPLVLYRRLGDGGRERATNESLYHILHSRPTPAMSRFEFIEYLTASTCLTGNGYAEIIRDSRGIVSELRPLDPYRVSVRRGGDGMPVYEVRSHEGPARRLLWDEVFHLRYRIGPDGVTGLSPITIARQAIGLNLAMQEHGARLFSNGAKPGGVLQHPGVMSAEAQKRFIDSWNEKHAGAENAHKVAILEEGMTFQALSMTSEDSQWLESRRFGVEEICRIFRIAPTLIQDYSRATYSNISETNRAFANHTLMPWAQRWETAIERSLLAGQQADSLYAEFAFDALLRGDHKTRMEAYQLGRNAGIYSVNEIRRLENLASVEGGDSRLQPLNMAPLGSAPAAAEGAQ